MGVDPPPRGAFGCWWWWWWGSHRCPTPLPPLQDGGMPADDAQAMAWGSGGARGHRWPRGDTVAPLAVSPALWVQTRGPRSVAATSSSTQPPPRRDGGHRQAPVGSGCHGQQAPQAGGGPRWPSGFPREFGACGFRLRNPTWDAVSTATAGQRAVRGAGCSARDCNHAAAAEKPPGRGAGARCRAGRRGRGGEGRRRCGGCAGRGGGQAGAAGEAASGSVWRCQQRCH